MVRIKKAIQKKEKKEKNKKETMIKKLPKVKVDFVESSQKIEPKLKSLVRDKKYATLNGVEKKPEPKKEKYFEAVGRRKTSVARIRFFTKGEKIFLVNEKPYDIYFPSLELQQIVLDAFQKMKCLDKFRVLVKVKGGGYHSQAEAIRQATARALVFFNPDFKKRLKKVGYLTRDPRMRERKKFGLKRARRAPQWAKR